MSTFKFENYYLDIDKVSKLDDKEEKQRIHNYYIDMLTSSSDQREEMAKSLFHTLYNNGYLKEVRDEKLKQVLS